MYLEEFPSCCGISTIVEFPYTLRSLEGVSRQLDLYEEEHQESRAGLLMCVLDKQQKKLFGSTLKRKGYVVLGRPFHNSRHHSTLTMYCKYTPRPKRLNSSRLSMEVW